MRNNQEKRGPKKTLYTENEYINKYIIFLQ
jgi:hypothetical protein